MRLRLQARIACVVQGVAAVLVLGAPPAAADPPANDDFADAAVIPSLPFTAQATFLDATVESAPGCPGPEATPTNHGDVWYRYTPTAAGRLEATLSATYGGYTISVWTGSCGDMTRLDADGTNVNWRAGVIVPVEAGTTYYLNVYYIGQRDWTTLTVRHHTLPHPVVARNGKFLVRDSFSTGIATRELRYGRAADHPVFGDWDGDGRTTVGVVRGNQWYLRDADPTGTRDVTFRFGRAGDVPVVGDWDGDGRTSVGVVRGNTWYLRYSNTQGIADTSFRFGLPTDVPVVGDWEHTGYTNVGVFRAGVWYLKNLENVTFSIRYGMAGDRPLVGDWDGDGRDTPAVVRRGTWYLRDSLSTGVADRSFRYGGACDRALTLTQALTRAPCDR